jgi:steroid delta-isomerase-like uncharacterized protein
MSDSNQEVVRRLYVEVWNQRKLDVIDEIVSESHALNDPTILGAAAGPEAYKIQVKKFLAAFPDLRFTVEDVISEKDKLVAVWTITGTQKGEFLGIAPTHRKVSISGISIHQLADGKILDTQAIWDALGLLQQLGVAPPFKNELRVASAP